MLFIYSFLCLFTVVFAVSPRSGTSLALARFPVPDMIYPPLSRPLVSLESRWLRPRNACHYCLRLLCHTAHCCGSQASELGRTVGCFPPLEACMEPSGTMNASSWGGGVKIRSSSDPLGLVSELHGNFINKDLPFISRRQPEVIAIAYNFSEVSLDNTD